MLDLIIKNGSCYIDNDLKDNQAIAIKESQIVEIGKITADAKDTFDALTCTGIR